jgi:putative transcriptional regulator
MSKIIESLRGDLAALSEIDAIDKATLREFDAICPLPARESGAQAVRLTGIGCAASPGAAKTTP